MPCIFALGLVVCEIEDLNGEAKHFRDDGGPLSGARIEEGSWGYTLVDQCEFPGKI